MTAALRLVDPCAPADPPEPERPGESHLQLAPPPADAEAAARLPPPSRTPTLGGVPRLLPVDVVFGCADADSKELQRTFPALHRAGCVPMLLSGLDYDPDRLRDSLDAAGEERLYVFVKTPSLDQTAVQSLVDCFARHRSEGHRLLVLELRPQRVYSLVPAVRRAADRLRGGLSERRIERRQPRAPAPWQTLVGVPVVGEPVPMRRPKPLDLDTSYCIHFLRTPPAHSTMAECEPGGPRRRREMPLLRSALAPRAPPCAAVRDAGAFSTCAW